MEIQDRNSLLQQLFSPRAGNAQAILGAEKGFAEMLKPQKNNEAAVVVAEDFTATKAVKSNTAVKEKADLPVKDNKKKADEVKQPAKSETKKSRETKAKDQVGTAAVENNNTPNQPVKPADKPASSENIAGVSAENPVSDAEQVMVDDAMTEAAPQTTMAIQNPLNLLPLDGEQTVVENIVLPLTAAVLAGEENIATPQAPTPDLGGEALAQPLTEEEALLLEQAKYLDEKIASPDKLKIDVTVKEAKIAEPLAKDVLQNRFEIDAMFQSVDAKTAIADADLDATLPVADNATPADNKPAAVIFNPAGVKAMSAAEGQIAPDAASSAASESSKLAISGKEVVFETVNSARSETFARINESSSRDAFKGMGKEVVEQIKVNITKSAVKGIDTIDIQLKPEDLGKIQIKMHIAKNGKLQAEIISSRPETMDLLQKDASGLAKAFNDAGYDTDSRSFNFSFQEENQAREQQKNDSGLRQFIGDTLEQEAESAAGNDNLVYDPLLGLNIRV